MMKQTNATERGRTPGGHQTPRAKLIMVSIPSADLPQSREFYGELMGTKFARALYRNETKYHAPVSAGVQLDIGKPYCDGQPIVAQFAVRDLDRSIERVKNGGGKVVVDNLTFPLDPNDRSMVDPQWRAAYGVSAPADLGRGAIVMDPSGNLIGLIEMTPGAEASFKRGHLSDADLDNHAMSMANAMAVFQDPDTDKDDSN